MRFGNPVRTRRRVAGGAVISALLLGSVLAGAASAEVSTNIGTPSDGASFSWSPGASYAGECRHTGDAAVIATCDVQLARGGTLIESHVVGPGTDPNVRPWQFPIPCVAGSYEISSFVTGTGGGGKSASSSFTLDTNNGCDGSGGGGGGGTGGAGTGGGPPPPPPNNPPTAHISTPADGSTYYLNESIGASYGCGDPDGNLSTCTGPVANGAGIDTGSLGAKSFVVNAQDAAGATGSATTSYTVYDRPSVAITRPADGTVYTPDQGPVPVFNGGCAGGIPGVSCTRTVTAPDGSVTSIGDGSSVPYSQFGWYTLRVTVVDTRNTTVSTTRAYRINHPPTAAVASPIAGKRYFVGQKVLAATRAPIRTARSCRAPARWPPANRSTRRPSAPRPSRSTPSTTTVARGRRPSPTRSTRLWGPAGARPCGPRDSSSAWPTTS